MQAEASWARRAGRGIVGTTCWLSGASLRTGDPCSVWEPPLDLPALLPRAQAARLKFPAPHLGTLPPSSIMKLLYSFSISLPASVPCTRATSLAYCSSTCKAGGRAQVTWQARQRGARAGQPWKQRGHAHQFFEAGCRTSGSKRHQHKTHACTRGSDKAPAQSTCMRAHPYMQTHGRVHACGCAHAHTHAPPPHHTCTVARPQQHTHFRLDVVRQLEHLRQRSVLVLWGQGLNVAQCACAHMNAAALKNGCCGPELCEACLRTHERNSAQHGCCGLECVHTHPRRLLLSQTPAVVPNRRSHGCTGNWYGCTGNWYGCTRNWYGCTGNWYGCTGNWYGCTGNWYGCTRNWYGCSGLGNATTSEGVGGAHAQRACTLPHGQALQFERTEAGSSHAYALGTEALGD